VQHIKVNLRALVAMVVQAKLDNTVAVPLLINTLASQGYKGIYLLYNYELGEGWTLTFVIAALGRKYWVFSQGERFIGTIAEVEGLGREEI
jgi:hypothetical protein